MTGEEWLTRVFDPALRTLSPPYRELRGALGALSECGVLSDELLARARERLDEAEGEDRTFSRQRFERLGAPGSHAGPARGRLEALLTPGHALGDVDGITVVLVLVELWTARSCLRLEALPNELTDTLDADYDREWSAFAERRRARRDGAEVADADLRPPEQPSVSRLAALPLSVSDDVGTRYHAGVTSTGGRQRWRSEWEVEPGVPASASVLTVALEGGGTERACLELDLPARH